MVKIATGMEYKTDAFRKSTQEAKTTERKGKYLNRFPEGFTAILDRIKGSFRSYRSLYSFINVA